MPVKPIIELSGVRNSCDMVARKADFSRSAASARSLATASSAVRSATRRSKADVQLPDRILRPFEFRDVRADAQDLGHPALRVPDDLVGPGNPDALPIAAHVLVDVLFKNNGVGANPIHEPAQVASASVAHGTIVPTTWRPMISSAE